MQQLYDNLEANKKPTDEESTIFLILKRRINLVCEFCDGIGHL